MDESSVSIDSMSQEWSFQHETDTPSAIVLDDSLRIPQMTLYPIGRSNRPTIHPTIHTDIYFSRYKVDESVLHEDWQTSTVFIDRDPIRDKIQDYLERLNVLCNQALEDGYGLSGQSAHDFLIFIHTEHQLRRGNLILMDNGNLRIMWKDEQGTQLGLQFLGDRVVQYVVFKQRRAAKHVSRVAGRDTFDGLKRQIESFELKSLLCE